MKPLRIATGTAALLIALGEIARWWGDARFIPMAFDELAVAGLMLWAAASRRAQPLLLAWGAFCGLMLSLLVPTLDHLLHGPPKESALFYAAALSVLLLLGAVAAGAALRISREPPP